MDLTTAQRSVIRRQIRRVVLDSQLTPWERVKLHLDAREQIMSKYGLRGCEVDSLWQSTLTRSL